MQARSFCVLAVFVFSANFIGFSAHWGAHTPTKVQRFILLNPFTFYCWKAWGPDRGSNLSRVRKGLVGEGWSYSSIPMCWSEFQQLLGSPCGGSERSSPRYASDVHILICRCFWAKGNFSCGLKRNICPSINYLKDLNWGGLAHKKRSDITSFALSRGQGKLLITRNIYSYPLAMTLWSSVITLPGL